MNDLTQRHCVPCEGGTAPLNSEQEQMYLSAVPDWDLNTSAPVHFIQHEFVCKNFLDAVEIVGKIAKIAEEQGHHPDLRIFEYKHLEVTLTTHAIKGLSENDFIMAAKIDEALKAK